MTFWRCYVAVLATLAVAGIGWIGWEEHRQTEEQVERTCIARVASQNATDVGLLGLRPLPAKATTVEIIADAAVEGEKRLAAC